MKQKKRTKAIAMILAFAMVFTFIPFMGTQKVCAMSIYDPITIDMTDGSWSTLYGQEGRAIERFIWDAAGRGEVGLSSTGSGTTKCDFDYDNVIDMTMTIQNNPYKMTLKPTENCSLQEVRLKADEQTLIQYIEMEEWNNEYSLVYYFGGINFILKKKKVEIKDSLSLDFSQGTKEFNGAEAAAIGETLYEMGNAGIIGQREEYLDNHTWAYWYDLDKDNNDDIYENGDEGSFTLEVLGTCNLTNYTLTLPEEWVSDWALNDVGTFGVEYVYREISFKLKKAIGVKDKKIVNLYNGVQKFNGVEALAMDSTLFEMGDRNIISRTENQIGNKIYEDLYDLDKNGTNDVRAVTDFNKTEFTLEKLNTCSIKKSTTLVSADATIEEYTAHPAGWADGVEYIYKSITLNMAQAVTPTVTLSRTSFAYNGKTQKPTVTVKVGSKKLTSADYTIVNNGRKDVGKGSVKVTLKRNYIGSKTVTYQIVKAKNTLAVKAKTATIKYKKLKKKTRTLAVGNVITFTKKGQGALTYAKASGNKKITIDKTTGKVTVKKRLKKGTYKVKATVKAAGNANYNAAVKTVTFTVIVK